MSKQNVKLAELLLLRKELQQKVDRLRPIGQRTMYETKTGRGKCEEGFNDMIAEVPKISFQQFTHAYDTAAKNLRLVDAAIQQANWTCEVEIDADAIKDYVDPYVEDKVKKD